MRQESFTTDSIALKAQLDRKRRRWRKLFGGPENKEAISGFHRETPEPDFKQFQDDRRHDRLIGPHVCESIDRFEALETLKTRNMPIGVSEEAVQHAKPLEEESLVLFVRHANSTKKLDRIFLDKPSAIG